MITPKDIANWDTPKKCERCNKMVEAGSHNGVSCQDCGGWVCDNCKNAHHERCALCGGRHVTELRRIIY
jgi:hypothetical protein